MQIRHLRHLLAAAVLLLPFNLYAQTKISQLPAASALTGTEAMAAVQPGSCVATGGTCQTTPAQIATYVEKQLPVFVPTALTAAGIQAAMAAAGTAGGGVVSLPAGTISLSATLTPVQGVYLIGVAPQVNTTSGIPDNPNATFTGGTVLTCTGAFPAISLNLTVLGTPASAGAFTATGLFNVGFKNFGVSGCTYGIQAGATNNASFWYSEFENLYFSGQTVWGMWLTNYQHCDFRRIYSFGAVNGQFHGVDVPGTILDPGNSTYFDLYNVIPSGGATNWASRGIVFNVANTVAGENNNQFKMDRIQSNRFGASSVTQAATMANTSANITVVDGTKFALQLPVTFTTTANGFTANKVYFVTSIAGNVIQVSLTQGGATPVTATGATAINITHNGFPAFEFVAFAGSSMTNAVISNLDVESGGTCGALFQNAIGVTLHLSQVPGFAQSTASICGRAFTSSQVWSPNTFNSDFDSSSNGAALQVSGARQSTSSGPPGAGMWYDFVSGNTVLSLGATFDSPSSGALQYIPSQANLLQGNNIAEKGAINGNASPTLGLLGGVVSFTAGVGNVITLPAFNSTTAGTAETFVNQTANSVTITAGGGQLFNNKTALTSITVSPNASVRIQGGNFTGAVFGPVIVGFCCSYSAGTITGP